MASRSHQPCKAVWCGNRWSWGDWPSDSQTFKSAGSEVLLVDKEAALDAALAAVGGGVRGLAINLTNDGSAAAVTKAATEQFGGVDILISNAGYAHEGLSPNWTRPICVRASS